MAGHIGRKTLLREGPQLLLEEPALHRQRLQGPLHPRHIDRLGILPPGHLHDVLNLGQRQLQLRAGEREQLLQLKFWEFRLLPQQQQPLRELPVQRVLRPGGHHPPVIRPFICPILLSALHLL